MGKVKAVWERDDGYMECEDGNIYLRNPMDPRPSRMSFVCKKYEDKSVQTRLIWK